MSGTIEELADRLGRCLDRMHAAGDERASLLEAQGRAVVAIRDALEGDTFRDPPWVESLVVALGDLFLDSVREWDQTGSAPGPWQVVFRAGAADPSVPRSRRLLMALAAHLEYDLPQALLAVAAPEESDDPHRVEARAADHRRLDEVVAARVDEARGHGGKGRRDRRAARRALDRARARAWANAAVLAQARRDGPAALKARLDELGSLSAARVTDLAQPGDVRRRLTRRRTGVALSRTPPSLLR